MTTPDPHPNRLVLRGMASLLACLQHHPKALREVAATAAFAPELAPYDAAFRELGVNFSISPWLGIFAPKGVTAEMVQRVNAVVNRAAREDAQFLNRWYTEQAIEFWPNTPAQFAEFFQKDLELAGRLVKIAGVTLD